MLDTRLELACLGHVRSLNLLLMLLGALSVLLLGVVPSLAKAADGPPPCHEELRNSSSPHEAPPEKRIAAMTCCVSCVVSPVLQAPPRTLEPSSENPTPPIPASLPIGLSLAPDHGPPKG